MKTLPCTFTYLRGMYHDGYFPTHLVDRVRDTIIELVSFLESGEHATAEVQEDLDRVAQDINVLQAAFESEGSEIETVARNSIGVTIREILSFFEIDLI